MLTRAIILLLCLLPCTALAATPLAQFSLSILPAVLHLSVLQGATYQGTLQLHNEGSVPVRIHAEAFDFVPVNEQGGVKLLPRDASSTESDPIASVGWVRIPSGDLAIAPNRVFNLPIIITVPEGASPGARSIAITMNDVNGNTRTELQSLIFLDIPGDVKKDMVIANFSADSFFAGSNENVFHVRLANTGKTHVRPGGELVIRNMFGRIRGRFKLDAGNAVGTIAPNSSRAIEYHWKGGSDATDFGLWLAVLSLNDGDLHTSDYAVFLVLPWLSMLVFACGLLLSLAFLCRALMYMRKSLNLENIHEHDGGGSDAQVSISALIFVMLAGLLFFAAVGASLFIVFRAQEGGLLERVSAVRILGSS